MKVTPLISADIEEYPELRKILNMALRPVVDIMGAHAISSIRRIHKTGVFDHPYDKDLVVPLALPGVPESVRASQYTVGKALLDYLSAIGVSGLTIEAGQDELRGLMELWQPQAARQAPAEPEKQSKAADSDEPGKELEHDNDEKHQEDENGKQ